MILYYTLLIYRYDDIHQVEPDHDRFSCPKSEEITSSIEYYHYRKILF